ncbi:MAG: hypothetical protein Q8S18_13045 [Bacteroidales bacterium]|nr:hypothetical protein [Bacteroidales bacterium]
MKIYIRLVVFLLLMLPISMIGQIYVGEVVGDSAKPDVKTKKERKQRNAGTSAGKEKYFQFTYFMPEMYPEFIYNEGPFIQGSGPSFGALFEKGGFRFFSDNFMINDMANIGLFSSIGLGVEIHDFNLQDDFDGYKLPFFFADYKIGPDFRFEVSNNLKFDLYGSIGVLACYGGFVDGTQTGINGAYSFSYQPKSPVIALQTGVGFNVVLMNWLILGTHLTFADGAFKYLVEDDFGSNDVIYDVSLSSFRVSLGFFP